MNRLLRLLRRLRCEHDNFHTTGRTCPDGGFQVQCVWCGHSAWLCCHCPPDCAVCT